MPPPPLQKERLSRPTRCPDELWQLITSCWQQDPAGRPTFQEVLDRVQELQRAWRSNETAPEGQQLGHSLSPHPQLQPQQLQAPKSELQSQLPQAREPQPFVATAGGISGRKGADREHTATARWVETAGEEEGPDEDGCDAHVAVLV